MYKNGYYYFISLSLIFVTAFHFRWHFSEQRWEWLDGCVMLR